MAEEKKSWLRRRTEDAIRGGLTRAYETVRVDPERFLFQLRAAYGLPIVTYHGVYSVEMSRLDDVAESVIRSGMKLAAAEGAGFGLGVSSRSCRIWVFFRPSPCARFRNSA
jgi:hypothetical protein